MARGLYVERLRETWLPRAEGRADGQAAAETLYLRGDLAPLCDFIEQGYFSVLSNRNYRWTNELLVKFAFLTLLFDDRLYMVVSELETERGYADLALIRRSDRRRVNEAEAQARDYGATLMQRHGLKTLHAFAVVALGVERLVWRAVVIARD